MYIYIYIYTSYIYVCIYTYIFIYIYTSYINSRRIFACQIINSTVRTNILLNIFNKLLKLSALDIIFQDTYRSVSLPNSARTSYVSVKHELWLRAIISPCSFPVISQHMGIRSAHFRYISTRHRPISRPYTAQPNLYRHKPLDHDIRFKCPL
jgi:hypothetical protein